MRRLAQASLIAAAVVASMGLAPVQSQSADAILTGEWEYSYRVFGLPYSERKCVRPADVRNFAGGICFKNYRCDYDERKVVANGQIDLKGTWTDKKGRTAPAEGRGAYGLDNFTMSIKARTVNGLPLIGSIKAHRVAATCPAK